jgi:hypothetical protein
MYIAALLIVLAAMELGSLLASKSWAQARVIMVFADGAKSEIPCFARNDNPTELVT